MKHLTLLTIIFLGFITGLQAYPITPRPLRLLVKQSQNIIVGYVSSVRDSFTKTNKIENGVLSPSYGFGPEITTIKVLESLQGSITTDSVQVDCYTNVICPTPARYQKQTWVIAFLDKTDRERYTTHALSYGVKTLKQEEIEIYKKRILEIQQILRIDDETLQFTKTVEWLVKCAETEATRWEGLTELNPRWGYISLYSDGSKRDLNTLLNADQAARLKPILIDNVQDDINLGLADLLYNTYPKEIESRLIEKLKNMGKADYMITAEYIPRLKSTHHLPEVKELIKNYNLLSITEKKQNCGDFIKQFIKLIK